MASKEQSILFDIIISTLKDKEIIQDFRPNFLKNKKTGKNFEIDIYCKNLKIGFEYQGAIHFEKIKKFNNNPDNSRLNDILKSNIFESIKGKFVVVEIFEEDLKGNIKLNISKRCFNTAILYKDCFAKYKLLIYMYLGFKYSNYKFIASMSGFNLFNENDNAIPLCDNLKTEIDNLIKSRKIKTKNFIIIKNNECNKVLKILNKRKGVYGRF